MSADPAEFGAVMARLCAASGAVTSADLARLLEMSGSDFAQRKGRGVIPWDRVFTAANSRSISIDWLVTGTGPMRRGEDALTYPLAAAPEPAGVEDSAAASLSQPAATARRGGVADMCEYLTAWWETATPDERVWLKVQMCRCLPEFADWLSAHDPTDIGGIPDA